MALSQLLPSMGKADLRLHRGWHRACPGICRQNQAGPATLLATLTKMRLCGRPLSLDEVVVVAEDGGRR